MRVSREPFGERWFAPLSKPLIAKRGDAAAAEISARMSRFSAATVSISTVAGSSESRVLMKRGQNIGYQSYMLLFPETGRGIVVVTGSDNGTTLATALIRRAAAAYKWRQLGRLHD
jgi:hypothetical protein